MTESKTALNIDTTFVTENKTVLNIYTVRPLLEYGSKAWSTTAKTNQQTLDKAQHQALAVHPDHSLFVGRLLKFPATCQCISGTDLLKQVYVLSH